MSSDTTTDVAAKPVDRGPQRAPGVLRSMWILTKYSDRVWDGVKQDLRLRYTGSVMGWAWAFIFPLGQLAIYAFLYVVIFGVRPTGLTEYEYVLLVFSGLVPLFAFSEMLTLGLTSLNSNKALLMSTVFPAELIPLRASLAGTVPMLAGMVATMILCGWVGHLSWETFVFVPILWILLIMFTTGISWILSLLSLVMTDIQHGIGLVLMLLIFLSPFAYTPDMVPDGMKGIIYINPMSYFVLSFQDVLVYQRPPGLVQGIGTLILSFGMFFLGFVSFNKGKPVFFDYI